MEWPLQTLEQKLVWFDIDNENNDPNPMLSYYMFELNSDPPILKYFLLNITERENKTLSQLKKNAREEMKLNKGSKNHNKLESDFLNAAMRISHKNYEENGYAMFLKYECN